MFLYTCICIYKCEYDRARMSALHGVSHQEPSQHPYPVLGVVAEVCLGVVNDSLRARLKCDAAMKCGAEPCMYISLRTCICMYTLCFYRCVQIHQCICTHR